MLSQSKPVVDKYIQVIVKPLSFLHPNILTILGSIPPLLFFFFLVTEHFVIALVVFLFTAIDMLDGAVARMSGKTSRFGGFLDSTVDRISDFLIISAFGFANLVSWGIVIPFLASSFLVSYVRSRGELASGGKMKFNVGIMERPERLIGIFIAVLLQIIFPLFSFAGLNIASVIFFILLTLSLITLLQRIILAYYKLNNT